MKFCVFLTVYFLEFFWSWSYFNFFVIFPLLVGMESCTSSWTDRANKLEFCRFCIILVVVSMLLFLHNSRFRFFSSLTIFISTHKRPEISAQKKSLNFNEFIEKRAASRARDRWKIKINFFLSISFLLFCISRTIPTHKWEPNEIDMLFSHSTCSKVQARRETHREWDDNLDFATEARAAAKERIWIGEKSSSRRREMWLEQVKRRRRMCLTFCGMEIVQARTKRGGKEVSPAAAAQATFDGIYVELRARSAATKKRWKLILTSERCRSHSACLPKLKSHTKEQ